MTNRPRQSHTVAAQRACAAAMMRPEDAQRVDAAKHRALECIRILGKRHRVATVSTTRLSALASSRGEDPKDASTSIAPGAAVRQGFVGRVGPRLSSWLLGEEAWSVVEPHQRSVERLLLEQRAAAHFMSIELN